MVLVYINIYQISHKVNHSTITHTTAEAVGKQDHEDCDHRADAAGLDDIEKVRQAGVSPHPVIEVKKDECQDLYAHNEG